MSIDLRPTGDGRFTAVSFRKKAERGLQTWLMKNVVLEGIRAYQSVWVWHQQNVALICDLDLYKGEVVSIVVNGQRQDYLVENPLGLINLTEGEIYFEGKNATWFAEEKK
jgi:hypothetical protein